MNKIVQLTDGSNNPIYPVGYSVGGVKMDLLWTNPNPTSSFASQTLSLDLSGYDWLIIRTKSLNTEMQIYNNLVYKDNAINVLHSPLGNGSSVIITRQVTVNSTSAIFGNGYSSTTSNNTFCVPIYIYGIKTLFITPSDYTATETLLNGDY